MLNINTEIQLSVGTVSADIVCVIALDIDESDHGWLCCLGLGTPRFGVETILDKECIVIASFNHFSLLHDMNHICLHRESETVSNNDRGATARHLPESL